MGTSAEPGRGRFRGVVAVDGPSGSGKSSVCRAVAHHLDVRYLDTGSMYRAVTWAALDRRVNLAHEPAVAALARAVDLTVGTDPETPTIAVDGVDITSAIRATRISEAVSAVATNLAVRASLVQQQRALIAAARSHGVVAEGRDITTVVAPDAEVRLLLTASEEARLARRAREVHGTADGAALAATRAQVLARDARDATVVEFHSAADGVAVLDTSTLTFDEVVEAVLDLIAARAGAPGGVR